MKVKNKKSFAAGEGIADESAINGDLKKSKSKAKLRLHRYIIAVFVAILFAVVFFAGGLSAILEWAVNTAVKIPDVAWIVAVSVTIGFITYFFLRKSIVSPLYRLEKAMTEVAKGDFSVKLETNSRIEEIKKIYDSFNIMVEELKSTELLQSDFVTNVSHEFKTPLNAIEGYATLLQGDTVSADGNENIEKILQNTGRLSVLIGDILLLSKIENRTIDPDKQRYSLDEQVRQAVVNLESKWESKNIDIEANLEDVSFYGNQSLMMHVFVNLIDNAVKFSPEGGRIFLNLTKSGGGIIFTIADEGPGICIGSEQHIFDKFYQGDNSHSKEGNGLGLALVKRIVAVHGGSVKAENISETNNMGSLTSDYPAHGALFTVSLPLAD